MKSNFYRYKLHHVLFWIIYGTFWIVITHDPRSQLWQEVVLNSFFLSAHMGAAYLSMYYLLPRYLYQNKYVLFSVLSFINLILFSFLIALGFYVTFYNYPEALAAVMRWEVLFPAGFLSVLTTVMILSLAKVMQYRMRLERKARTMEKEKLSTELDYLKAQINPHFLFNAINNIYFLIKKNPELASDSLLKFSDMLRYQLYDCADEYINLEQELAYLRNYITIKQLGHEGLDVIVNINGEPQGKSIAPMVLIPFVENAFKHVSTARTPNFIEIDISIDEEALRFFVRNSYEDKEMSQGNGGIGLANVKRRLNLIYPRRHQLKVVKDEQVYSVELKLQLNEVTVPDSR